MKRRQRLITIKLRVPLDWQSGKENIVIESSQPFANWRSNRIPFVTILTQAALNHVTNWIVVTANENELSSPIGTINIYITIQLTQSWLGRFMGIITRSISAQFVFGEKPALAIGCHHALCAYIIMRKIPLEKLPWINHDALRAKAFRWKRENALETAKL